jgi:hypothetical protein
LFAPQPVEWRFCFVGIRGNLHTCTLFTGSGLGSLLFAGALSLGLAAALMLFGTMAVLMAAAAVPVFRGESSPPAPAAPG